MKILLLLAVILSLTGCCEFFGTCTDENNENSSTTSNTNNNQTPVQRQCTTYERPSIYPSYSPQYYCGPTGSITNLMIRDINSFWGTNMFACSCGADQPQCIKNALVYGDSPTSQGFGYIYYDAQFLEFLTLHSNTVLAPAWLLSHEAGHNIQSSFILRYPTTASKELSADCFSGYFLGSLVCNGRTNETAIMSTLNTLCAIDNGVNSYLNPRGHGSCNERVNAIEFGIQQYLRGIPPLNSC